ncbi:hypothetical protein [Prevotellamassilia timonensis]|uniref:hypothetical protein n=1 Tax=Prevotellamassilia timonensis TaxID=1852370 RepID=UPI004025C817
MNTIYKHTIRRIFGCVLLSTLPLGVMAQNVRVIKSDGTIKMYDGSKQNIKVTPVPTVNTNDKVKTGSTLYDNLQALGNYTTYLRLIDSFAGIQRAFKNELTDYERKYMGSFDTLTVFAPNDEAFDRFFAHNVWTDEQGNAISSYEQLSDSQKLSLIYMSYIPGFVTANSLHASKSVRGYLRLYSYDRQFNLVPYKHTGGTDINTFPPDSYSYIDYAKELNQHIVDGVWIGYGTIGDYTGALAYRGGTMIWNDDYWQYNGLSHDDLVFIGAADTESSEHITIGNAHITQPNQRCQNGYLHLVDEVVVPQPNLMCALAQARLGGKCSLASSLVQRFNYLKYDPDYAYYKEQIFNDGDSAMTVRNSLLDRVSTTTIQTPAIILPTDEALKAFLLASDNPLGQFGINQDNYYTMLMSLPREVLQSFVKEWFRTSFTDVLPSRYSNMRSAKGHQLLAGVATPEAYKLAVQQVIHAVDGIIVVVDAVPNAEDLRNELTFVKLAGQVAGAALTANDRYEYNTNAAPFSTDYQREMHNKSFTMFVPADAGLKQYGLVDPISMASNNRTSWRYWSLTPQSISYNGDGQIAVAAKAYRYDYNKVRNTETDRPLGATFSSSANDNCVKGNYGTTKRQLLTDMLDQHIVLQNLDSMLNTSRHWYLSRSGMPIYMKEHTNTNIVVNGGMQIDLNERDAADKHDCTLQFVGQNSTGTSVFIDRPMQPTSQNVFQRLQSNDAFSTFFEYAEALNNAYTLKKMLFGDEASEALSWKYTIFADRSGGYTRYGNANTMLVNFFHNFNYTIFVPTNEGMRKAFEAGLPTIEGIEKFVEESLDGNGQLPDDKREQAQAMYFTLLNFLKYHFCDKSYFLEPDLESGDTEQTTTACIDASNQQALTADINSGNGMLMVRDASNRYKAVKPDLANIIARDAEFNDHPTRARYIRSASNVVLHGIDNADYLLFDNTLNGDFTRAWRTPSAARKFVKKYGK